MKTIPRSSHQYGNKAITSVSACQHIIDLLDLRLKYPNPSKVDVVDVFSGYGLLSLMINSDLKPRNHLIIDNTKDNKAVWEDRIRFLNGEGNFKYYCMDGHSWETYDKLFRPPPPEIPVLRPAFQSREKIHDELFVIANLTNLKYGESLLAQWISCCGYQNWIQKYGRVRIVAMIRESTATKFLAGPKFPKRNRAALKRELFCNFKLTAISDTQADSVGMAGDLYDPNLLVRDQPLVLPNLSIIPSGGDVAIVEILPRDVGAMDVHVAEYLAQVLMYRSTHTVEELLTIMAPGAEEDLAQRIPAEVLLKTSRQLTRDDALQIYHAYMAWPFKPPFEETINFLSEETRSF